MGVDRPSLRDDARQPAHVCATVDGRASRPLVPAGDHGHAGLDRALDRCARRARRRCRDVVRDAAPLGVHRARGRPCRDAHGPLEPVPQPRLSDHRRLPAHVTGADRRSWRPSRSSASPSSGRRRCARARARQQAARRRFGEPRGAFADWRSPRSAAGRSRGAGRASSASAESAGDLLRAALARAHGRSARRQPHRLRRPRRLATRVRRPATAGLPCEAFAAWSFIRIIGTIPITPGGIGVIELGLDGAH